MRNPEHLLQLHSISDTNTPPRGGRTSAAKFDFGRMCWHGRSGSDVLLFYLFCTSQNICADRYHVKLTSKTERPPQSILHQFKDAQQKCHDEVQRRHQHKQPSVKSFTRKRRRKLWKRWLVSVRERGEPISHRDTRSRNTLPAHNSY